MSKYTLPDIHSKGCVISTWPAKLTIINGTKMACLCLICREHSAFLSDTLKYYQHQCLFSGLHMLCSVTSLYYAITTVVLYPNSILICKLKF